MAGLTVAGVTKRFDGRAVVNAVDLTVPDGGLTALIGPSGCGKTTLLRLIAGFERLDQGRILLGDRALAEVDRHLPPEARDIGMVFQGYALWPHLDVGSNVGFARALDRLDRAARRTRVAEALGAVGLAGFERRRVGTLSGGQRQRVALARCLAQRPALVLLDEPLGALDAHLKTQLQAELRAFHRGTGTTMVMVTHDQAEALALADRVAVMDRGRLAQTSSPDQLWREPATAFVARFVGRGAAVAVTVREVANGRARVERLGHAVTLRGPADHPPGDATACLRPEDLVVSADGWSVRVVDRQYEGARTLLTLVDTGGETLWLSLASQDPAVGRDQLTVTARDGWVLPVKDDPPPLD